ncbi:hypothetical protein [Mesorhizobium amorphae]|uniref:hypothetical protein n=1 Tax=Mesorhizobium amorphae TaxID=71433 RepID=UPI0017811A42|nr:hypothetical protein [Mesorhizobium amorphae]
MFKTGGAGAAHPEGPVAPAITSTGRIGFLFSPWLPDREIKVPNRQRSDKLLDKQETSQNDRNEKRGGHCKKPPSLHNAVLPIVHAFLLYR